MPSLRQQLIAAALLSGLALPLAQAEDLRTNNGRYYPLNQTVPPGTAGNFAVMSHPASRNYYQPVRFELPFAATVTFFQAGGAPIGNYATPAPAAFLVGQVYRVKISDIAGYPGVELYPSVELIDRLHPPAGKADEFPVPLTLSTAEIETVLDGRFITKIIYLEKAERMLQPIDDDPIASQPNFPEVNALAMADNMGRPMAILRIGGRTPDLDNPDPSFFGNAPVLLKATTQAKRPAAVLRK